MTRRIELSDPQFDMVESLEPVNIFLSGQGGGKTYTAGIISGYFVVNFPNVKGFIGANTREQLTDSTLFRIREVWKDKFGLEEFNPRTGRGDYVTDIIPPDSFDTTRHNYDDYFGKISFKNGCVLFKGSLEKYKAHDGKEFAWAILDETKDTREEAVKEVILGRLRERGMYEKDGKRTTDQTGRPLNQLFIFTSPAKVDWINDWFNLATFNDEINASIYSDKTYFAKKDNGKFVTISSSYHNRANLPEGFIDNLKSNLNSGLQDMLIYGNPFSKSGGEFYKYFKRETTISETTYNEELPLHISVDFNTLPCVTMEITQIEGNRIRFIDEITLEPPLNYTVHTAREFVRRYFNHKAGLFIYGDASGRSEDTRTERGFNDFRILQNELSKYSPSLRVPSKNPPVSIRAQWINTIFERHSESDWNGVQVTIDPKCKNLINDLTYLKEAADGGKMKSKVKDANTGATFEKYGHASDCMDYVLCQAFDEEFRRFQKGDRSINYVLGQKEYNISKRY